MLSLCQHGYEALLERELTEAGQAVTEKGPGWALCVGRAGTLLPAAGQTAGNGVPALPDMAFPSLIFPAPREFKGDSVNALAQQLADFFLESLRGDPRWLPFLRKLNLAEDQLTWLIKDFGPAEDQSTA